MSRDVSPGVALVNTRSGRPAATPSALYCTAMARGTSPACTARRGRSRSTTVWPASPPIRPASLSLEASPSRSTTLPLPLSGASTRSYTGLNLPAPRPPVNGGGGPDALRPHGGARLDRPPQDHPGALRAGLRHELRLVHRGDAGGLPATALLHAHRRHLRLHRPRHRLRRPLLHLVRRRGPD